MGRFVKPQTRQIKLAGDDNEWIEVKRDLNVWEDKRYRSAGFKRVSGAAAGGGKDAAVDVDWTELALARVETYLVDWNLRDDTGKSVPFSATAMRNLSPEAFEEIDAAIVKHVEEMAEEKKVSSGGTTPVPA